MRKVNPRCQCHICKVERHLRVWLHDLPIERFAKLTFNAPVIAAFADGSFLIEHLHAQQRAPVQSPSASEVLSALIQAGSIAENRELGQCLLILAFMPSIHRTYREICAWYRHIPKDDIAQQIFVYFLELAVSAPVEWLKNHLSFALARSLHRNAVRWARKEALILSEKENIRHERKGTTESAASDSFERVSLLNDFLDYCCRIGILSRFERDLLVKTKLEGFLAKEASDTHTVLSGKAVQRRIERIMERLKNAANETVSGQSCKSQMVEGLSELKNISQKAGHFSLGAFR